MSDEFLTIPPKSGYYAYLLVCPIRGDVFYVGKGKGRRMYQHMKDLDNPQARNINKMKRIKELHDAGLTPEYRVYPTGKNEWDALKLERQLIEKYRITCTNHRNGDYSPNEVACFQAKQLISRLISIDELRKRGASTFELEMRIKIENSLNEVVKRCNL